MNNITDITSIRASAVPSVPKTITPTQRLAALELARQISEYREYGEGYGLKLLSDAEKLLNELAGDAKVQS